MEKRSKDDAENWVVQIEEKEAEVDLVGCEVAEDGIADAAKESFVVANEEKGGTDQGTVGSRLADGSSHQAVPSV